ncbi:MAG: D-alanine--D-alanine ligase [Ignavibacteria bacterium CG_4_8_14_3_um_filter_37_9]|nr:ATP-grasp domain-containing protein [Ignavibacteria bacterium]PIS44494.1 MAG: D-alanine--D-alanine ligase [Ignavibacteria bacterium CG08_land_8_20_14_0_20_37_9]PIW97960.1 MAG: D-alanine--D-alanine ligase [Ignavibacteria bacterium CG_4_8_14_3_um_filter_37_9]PIX94381.1 MAG: D-alanine--D-alanine ligase [Ignavibacteria bacterium CG_4_10_14_3_um_filter_37_18]PJC57322.1 MAG: D-alanine--D-alanine ligase [Ignavibacteria bacterium CG_4_9_14_0_2_um_filter_37_13]
MNVALTFNVKPESTSFTDELSSNPVTSFRNSSKKIQDTFAEWDSRDTVNAVRDALAEFHTVTMIEADHNAFEKLKDTKPDIVFNVAEGFFGVSREAQIPAMLDMLNIPYTGSDPSTLAICLDKARTKEILSFHHIPTPKFLVIDQVGDLKEFALQFPIIVKPNAEGSSKGIFTSSFVKNFADLEIEVERVLNEYDQSALLEEFLPGREFTVAMLGNGRETEVLPIVEINYSEFPEDFIPIYSYEAKWILDTKENPLDVFSCPAKLSLELERKIKNVCLATYKVLRCKDWSRIDIRLDASGEPNIIEINPLPGILPDPKDNSCYPKAARTAGMDYTTLLNKVLFTAAKRYNLV